MIPTLPFACWYPPSCLRGGRVEWRGAVCAVVPRVVLGPASCIVPLPFVLSRPSVCLLSQHCWFSGVSLCQGCVIVE
nr:MAG TPA: hypothetical protein [Caudoviricetes sp.]